MEDDTEISFEFPDGTAVRITGSDLVVYSNTLFRVQQHHMINLIASDDLTGTRVVSNKPVAVFAGKT